MAIGTQGADVEMATDVARVQWLINHLLNPTFKQPTD